ncbi:MAG: OmpH family outer membrane protein [bacterium]|nr:OmpH family outer membrane protein [bacterium]
MKEYRGYLRSKQYVFMTAMLIMAFYFIFSGFAYKADFKVGYVNSAKLFETYSEFIDIQDKHKAYQEELQNEYNAMRTNAQNRYKEIESQSLLLSDEKKREYAQELQTLQDNINRFAQENFAQGGVVEQRWIEVSAPVMEKAQTVIDKLGPELGYDIIFDTSAGALVYAKSDYDMTDLVLEELEKNKK